MARQIVIQSAGGIEYTFPVTVTEATGRDISGTTVQVSFGTQDAPGTWVNADVSFPTPSQAIFKVLVNSSLGLAPAVYWMWVKIIDTPEVIIKFLDYCLTID